jgi:hypothetical protein
MNPLSIDLGNALLKRHRQICLEFTGNSNDVPSDLIAKSIISYKELLRMIGAPETLAQSIGIYLVELAEWCEKRNMPPINALAISKSLKSPGPGYYTAPGSTRDWERDVKDCIACRTYPRNV